MPGSTHLPVQPPYRHPGQDAAQLGRDLPGAAGPGEAGSAPPRRGTSTYAGSSRARAPRIAASPRGWRRAAVGPSSSGSTTSTSGRAARSTARSGATRRHCPACMAASASADGTVPVSTHSALAVAARRRATSRVWKRGARCSLWAKFASSSTITHPSAGSGASTLDLPPTTTRRRPCRNSAQARYRRRSDRSLARSAASGNAFRTASPTADPAATSGVTTIAPRPRSRVASISAITLAPRSSPGNGRQYTAPARPAPTIPANGSEEPGGLWTTGSSAAAWSATLPHRGTRHRTGWVQRGIGWVGRGPGGRGPGESGVGSMDFSTAATLGGMARRRVSMTAAA